MARFSGDSSSSTMRSSPPFEITMVLSLDLTPAMAEKWSSVSVEGVNSNSGTLPTCRKMLLPSGLKTTLPLPMK
jgi:hypothetical protein